MPTRESNSHSVLRAAAMTALVLGAAGSVGLMAYVGRRNPSWLLRLLFTVWVLSPFVGLLWANARFKNWPALTRTMLYISTVVVALGSLLVYGFVAFWPLRSTPAAAFLVIPAASWLVIGITVLISKRQVS